MKFFKSLFGVRSKPQPPTAAEVQETEAEQRLTREAENNIFEEPIPPGAENFKRLNESWYTYEFEGSKILVHRFGSSFNFTVWDSVVISTKPQITFSGP